MTYAHVEAIGYTRNEWAAMREQRHLTVLEALNDGIPLYGKALFAQWRSEFDQWLASGLRRDAVAWTLPMPQIEHPQPSS